MSAFDALVEKVARALHGGTFHPTPWDELPKWMKDDKRATATTALNAVGLPALLERVEAGEREVAHWKSAAVAAFDGNSLISQAHDERDEAMTEVKRLKAFGSRILAQRDVALRERDALRATLTEDQ